MSQTTGSNTMQLDFMSQIRLRFGLALVGFYSVMSLIIFAVSFTNLEIDIDIPRNLQLLALVGSLGLLALLLQQRFVLVVMNILAIITALYAHTVPSDQLFLTIGFTAIIIAAMFGSWYIHTANTLIFGYGLVAILIDLGDDIVGNDIVGAASIITVIVVISLLVRYVSSSVRHVAATSQRNTELLQATADVGQSTAQLIGQENLLDRAVELIRDRFGYYHVQIFLIDEAREQAELAASTGHVGAILMERGHKLEVGSQSVIGRVTQLGEPIIAQSSEEGVHARNELLPDTRSELALSLTDGERIIGALDVQSVQVNAFDETDIRALQVMANQIAVTIRNARLFDAQATNIQENKRLFLESEGNLREIQRLNQQLTQKVWSDYLEKKAVTPNISLDAEGEQSTAEWTLGMVEAGRRQRAIVSEDTPQVISVPIVLRGEVIGAMEVEPGIEARTDDTSEMMRAVAGHLAVSLDNARLFEEAQESATQEQRINEIVSRYQAAGTVDDLLQITLKELGSTLGAQHSKIRLSGLQKKPIPPSAPDEDVSQQNGGQQS
jgi:GAF domain-containing protein